ncbi:anthocyanidin 3-O-glucosyltransferase [Panicum miliaceum]|uniref:Glycosyltransferase n=1 Tax=Panicum miliaceum TaxID=4540 RepID=A0A3L6T6Q2_PANMI|nr:anthocyanidin 3-O-glucosyltransferase [Panicum miliaceum]
MAGAGDESSGQQLHVAIFPWLAFGHLLPCLELAERLASRGQRVSFVSTPRILARLRPVAPAAASLLDFVALPFPRVDGLPEGVEATSDVPAGMAELHREALDRLAPAFSAFLDAADGSGSKVDWVLLDSFHASIADVAHEHKVPCILNMPYSAESSVDYGVPDPKDLDNPLTPAVVRRFVQTFEKCKLIAYRSSFEIEPESMPLLAKIFGKPVIPVGVLPPPAAADTARDGDASLSWLDGQPSKSVVFVGFGSEYPMTLRQLHEIAAGLELAGTRFLWALKRPGGVAPDEDLLPPGFEERTRGRGSVVTGWAPQTSILAHAAVGAFMMHSGWGSTIEGLQYGQPMVMMPVLGDHLSTSRAMHERKIGVRVHKEKGDEAFLADNIARAIRAVMVDEESKGVYAANARKMQEIVEDEKSHHRYIDDFIQRLRTHKN